MKTSSLPGHIYSNPGNFALGFSDNVIWEEALSNTLDLTDTFSGRAIFPKTVSDTLTFSDEWDDSYNYPQVLTFSDSFSESLNSLLSLNDTLEFTDSFLCTGAFNHDVIHVLTFSDVYDHIKAKNYMVLKSRYGNIVLPAPLFGDSDSLNDLLLYKRSINGTKYTYVNNTNRSRLVYTFQLTKNKAIEFEQWLRQNDSEQVTIENWKGEKWRVSILSTSYDFTAIQRAKKSYELLTIPCEFEGVKII